MVVVSRVKQGVAVSSEGQLESGGSGELRPSVSSHWISTEGAWNEVSAVLWYIASGGETPLSVYAVFPRPFENEKELTAIFERQYRPMRMFGAALLFRVRDLGDLRQVPTWNIWLDCLYLLYSTIAPDEFPEIARKRKYHLWRDYDSEIAPLIGECDFVAILEWPHGHKATLMSKGRSVSDLQQLIEQAVAKAALQIDDRVGNNRGNNTGQEE